MGHSKKIKHKFIWFITLTFLFLLLSIFYTSQVNPSDYNRKTEKFQSALLKKEKLTDSAIKYISDQLKITSTDSLFFYNNYLDLYLKENIILLVYQDSVLKYWSDNTVDAAKSYSLNTNFYLFSNAWYEIRKKEVNQFVILGLIKILNAYPYENQYLNNNFTEEFNLPSNTSISFNESKYSIYNNEGVFLFTLLFPYHIDLNENKA
jgi:two-component system, NtrC family, nitrogen regulation sensor histidine kinase NtrY